MSEHSPPSAAAGSIAVAVTEDGRVLTVMLQRLPDSLRRPEPLAAEFARALAEAHGSRLPDPAPGTERVTANRVVMPPRRPLRELLEEQTARRRPAATGPSRALLGTARGVSDNGCVTVELDASGPGGRPEVDPGWLTQATASQVAAAITQAFADAYRERGNR
jgi:hypothetical protein